MTFLFVSVISGVKVILESACRKPDMTHLVRFAEMLLASNIWLVLFLLLFEFWLVCFCLQKGIILYGLVKKIQLYCVYKFSTQNSILFKILGLFLIKLFLKFRKFQSRSSYKIYSYQKRI